MIEKIEVISREEIPSLYSVVVDNKAHYLGILKDLKKHSSLNAFIPSEGSFSIAWVHLGQNEVLNTHVHPIRSLILVCKGEVSVVGDHNQILKEGDALLIPPSCQHGLIGVGHNGFWGLSIQFEIRGLYENPNEPLTKFIDLSNSNIKAQCSNLSQLFQINTEYLEEFKNHSLFKLFHSQLPITQDLKYSFLKHFQVWSDKFQKIVMARELFCDHPDYKLITNDHLKEEWGHNDLFKGVAPYSRANWDPILDATSSWFIWKINMLSENEKIVLVHMVIEASATVFYEKIPNQVWETIKSNHGELHRHLDASHDKIGLNMIEDLRPSDYYRLNQIQQEGWGMLNQCFQRIYELIVDETGA